MRRDEYAHSHSRAAEATPSSAGQTAVAETDHIAARDLLEIKALPHQLNDKPRDMAFRHKVLHIRRQQQRLIDIPGSKILAHSPSLGSNSLRIEQPLFGQAPERLFHIGLPLRGTDEREVASWASVEGTLENIKQRQMYHRFTLALLSRQSGHPI